MRIKISDDNVMMQSFILSQELIKVKNLMGSVTVKMLHIHGKISENEGLYDTLVSFLSILIWVYDTVFAYRQIYFYMSFEVKFILKYCNYLLRLDAKAV